MQSSIPTNTESLYIELKSKLKEGDLIFIAIDSFLYRQVAKGTGSWTSHVGLIIKDEGEWYVLESAVPKVTRCKLKTFLARSKDHQVSVRRLNKTINSEQLVKLKNKANHYKGTWYHLGFDFESNRQFCSKFVHLVYKRACDIELGKIQTFKELLKENPQANQTFWRIRYLGFIPWKRKTITPASQLDDPQLTTIFSNVNI